MPSCCLVLTNTALAPVWPCMTPVVSKITYLVSYGASGRVDDGPLNQRIHRFSPRDHVQWCNKAPLDLQSIDNKISMLLFTKSSYVTYDCEAVPYHPSTDSLMLQL